jgi:hypothetical protein
MQTALTQHKNTHAYASIHTFEKRLERPLPSLHGKHIVPLNTHACVLKQPKNKF